MIEVRTPRRRTDPFSRRLLQLIDL